MPTSRLQWFGDEVLRRILGTRESGLHAAATELLNASNPPERTGTLRDSGYVATNKRSTYRGDKQHKKEVRVPEGMAATAYAAFYAHMVENGTSKMAARPFLRPALDQAKRRAGAKAVVVMRGKLK